MSRLIIPDLTGGPMHPVEVVYPDPSKKPQQVREEEEARGVFTKKPPRDHSIELRSRNVAKEADIEFAKWAAQQNAEDYAGSEAEQVAPKEESGESDDPSEPEEMREKKPVKGENYVICEFCDKEYHRNGYSKHVKSCQRKARDEHIC